MTGLLADSASWRSTAPSPYAEALAEILVGVFGLYSARTVGERCTETSVMFLCSAAIDEDIVNVTENTVYPQQDLGHSVLV